MNEDEKQDYEIEVDINEENFQYFMTTMLLLSLYSLDNNDEEYDIVQTQSLQDCVLSRNPEIELKGNKTTYKGGKMDECNICKDFLILHDVIELSCNHIYHWKCLNEWVKYNNTCPCCKSVVKIETIVD